MYDREGNIVDFQKLHPASFSGTVNPLRAKEWLNDMENLLEVAHIPPKSQVNVMKIQFTDIARIWWKSEEARLERLIAWKVFSNGFYLLSIDNSS